jgi:hypothetical protein
MRERVLRDFFEGKLSAAELERDVAGSTKTSGPKSTIISIEDMDTEFVVTADMAVRLCDAVLSGGLLPDALHTIGFALTASDRFEWNGDEDEVLANVIADWSCPEVNYPLTLENVQRFREWLVRTDPYPAKPPRTSNGSNLVSFTEKKSVRRPLWKRIKRLQDSC